MSETQFGRQFFDRHMEYIMAKDMEAMIRETYTEDASLYNAIPFLDTPPPNVITGHDALIKAFEDYLAYQGEIQVTSLYNFLNTPAVISFQATFVSPKTGLWVVGDTWMMRGEKIFRHFGFAHRLGDA